MYTFFPKILNGRVTVFPHFSNLLISELGRTSDKMNKW